MAQVEVFRGQARRRWSEEDKRRLVAETLSTGGTVHGVARRYGVNTSQLFTWRKQLRAEADRPARPAAVPGFAAVTITPVAALSASVPAAGAVSSGALASTGLIEIELPGGGRIRIAGAPDPATVTAALRVLVRG
jgi:transposase